MEYIIIELVSILFLRGDTKMRRNVNLAGASCRRRIDCDDVFECLLDLLEDALGRRRRCRNRNNDVAGISNRRVNDCEDVFECLEDLLEDAFDENDRCRRF